MKRLFFLLLICKMTSGFSQTLGGSAYSVYGIGDIQTSGLGAYSSMGNAGIGSRSPSYANTINPAAINAFRAGTQILDFGFYSGVLTQTTDQEKESQGDGGLSHLNILIKPKKNWGISLGIRQLSKVSYNVLSENILDPDLGVIDINYDGSGGLNQIDLGTGFQIIEGLHFGIRGSLLFGSINQTENVSSRSEFRNFSVLSRQVYAKPLFDVGVQYNIPISSSSLTLGATWNPSFEAFSRAAQVISSSDGDTLSTFLDSELTIPQKFGLGASLQSRRIMLSVDASYELWDTYNTDVNENDFRNVIKIATGVEFMADPTGYNYADRIRWRAGFSINNYYQRIRNSEFNEVVLTAGIGFPTKRGGSIINLGYEYSLRGTQTNGLIREVGHVFSMSFSFRELWFAKRSY